MALTLSSLTATLSGFDGDEVSVIHAVLHVRDKFTIDDYPAFTPGISIIVAEGTWPAHFNKYSVIRRMGSLIPFPNQK